MEKQYKTPLECYQRSRIASEKTIARKRANMRPTARYWNSKEQGQAISDGMGWYVSVEDARKHH